MSWAQWLNLCTASFDVLMFLNGVVIGAVGLYALAFLQPLWKDRNRD